MLFYTTIAASARHFVFLSEAVCLKHWLTLINWKLLNQASILPRSRPNQPVTNAHTHKTKKTEAAKLTSRKIIRFANSRKENRFTELRLQGSFVSCGFADTHNSSFFYFYFPLSTKRARHCDSVINFSNRSDGSVRSLVTFVDGPSTTLPDFSYQLKWRPEALSRNSFSFVQVWARLKKTAPS